MEEKKIYRTVSDFFCRKLSNVAYMTLCFSEVVHTVVLCDFNAGAALVYTIHFFGLCVV